MRRHDDFDVAIVGGSLAGCAAATLFARRGARVALIEKAPSMDHYKVVCTHFEAVCGACPLKAMCPKTGVAFTADIMPWRPHAAPSN